MTTAERIPIWLYDKKLWINDADRRTTCADAVAALTGRRGEYAVAVDGGAAADPGARLLKIWRGLRPDQKLCLLRRNARDGDRTAADERDGAADECDGDAASETSGYRAHRKRRRDVVKYASRTVHPRRLSNAQAAEQLLELILEQSDTIRGQLKKLQDRERKIERIETETHRTRTNALGSNYVLDAYLGDDDDDDGCGDGGGCGGGGGGGGGGGDDKEEKDSGIAEGAASVDNDDGGGATAEAIGYLRRIVRINKKLYEHEERLIRLYVNVERCRDRDRLLDELRRADARLADAERAYRDNALLVRDADAELRDRLGYVEQLQYEAAIVDSQNEYLTGCAERHRHHPQNAHRVENGRAPPPPSLHRALDTLV